MWLSVLVLVVCCGASSAFISGHTVARWRANNVDNVRLIPLATKKDLQVIALDNQFNDLSDAIDLSQDLEDEADDQHFIAYLQDEFSNLSTNGMLSFDAFVEWEEIQDILADEFLTLQQLSQIWNNNVGTLTETSDFVSFLKINEAIDMAV